MSDIREIQRLHELIERTTADVDEPAPVETVTVVGDPETELAKAAEDADLLVVGGHGQSPLAGVFLGSVAAATIRHATCPVLLIPNRMVDN